MVGDASEFHHDHSHVFHTRGKLDTAELFHRHVPAHVVDRRTAVVHPIGQRGDLVEGPSLGQFLKSPVYVSDGLLGIQDDLTIEREHVLEDAVRGRVGRPQVQRGKFAEVLALDEIALPEIGAYGFLHASTSVLMALRTVSQLWSECSRWVVLANCSCRTFSNVPGPCGAMVLVTTM